MNALETLQQKTNGIIFIKSYPILNKITALTLNDKQLIELVLSYQENNKKLSMAYKTIATVLNIEYQTVKNIVSKLKKLGIFLPEHKSNYNGSDGGGSSTKLKIDMDKLISLVSETISTEINLQDEPIKEEIIFESELIDNEDSNDDFIKSLKRNDDNYSISDADIALTNSFFLEREQKKLNEISKQNETVNDIDNLFAVLEQSKIHYIEKLSVYDEIKFSKIKTLQQLNERLTA